MKKIKIVVAGLFIAAIIVVNISIVGNVSENQSWLNLNALNLAFADPGESGCDVIITPGGGGTEGAILLESICSYSWPILEMEAECVWTGDCSDICMFSDEHDCA